MNHHVQEDLGLLVVTLQRHNLLPEVVKADLVLLLILRAWRVPGNTLIRAIVARLLFVALVAFVAFLSI